MGRLEGQVAIVTGGVRGIGRAIAAACSREGAAVAVLDLDEADSPPVRELGDCMGGSGKRGLYLRANVTERAEVQGAVEEVVRAFGRVDILVNNAGGGMDPVPLEDLEEADWSRVLTLNLTAAYLCSRALIKHMKAQGSGRIINISSQAGRSKSELANLPYASAKAGLLGFTRQLANEVGPYGITVNAVAPGLVLSGERVQRRWEARSEAERRRMVEAIPLRRLGTPEEIAAVVAFLASPEASYITGATIDVNGGRFML